MNIVPQLNLNKHPRTCAPNSLVDCRNMMFDVEKGVMSNENMINKSDVFDINILRNAIGDIENYEIIGSINCANEIVFFIKYNYSEETTNYICLYRTGKDNPVHLIDRQVEFIEGAKITGTHTYNMNGELIITFSQYVESNDKYFPLSTINLDAGDEVNYKLPIVPEVFIPYVKNYKYISGSAWYKGQNYFFIRYKINKYDYTQWYDLHKNIYCDNWDLRDIINVRLSESSDNPGRYAGFIKQLYSSDDSDISNTGINLELENLDVRYEYYQIGVLVIKKDYNKSFMTSDIPISNITVNVDSNVFKEDESSYAEFIKEYNNIYNVKEITNFKNKVFISNYIERNKDIDFEVNAYIDRKAYFGRQNSTITYEDISIEDDTLWAVKFDSVLGPSIYGLSNVGSITINNTNVPVKNFIFLPFLLGGATKGLIGTYIPSMPTYKNIKAFINNEYNLQISRIVVFSNFESAEFSKQGQYYYKFKDYNSRQSEYNTHVGDFEKIILYDNDNQDENDNSFYNIRNNSVEEIGKVIGIVPRNGSDKDMIVLNAKDFKHTNSSYNQTAIVTGYNGTEEIDGDIRKLRCLIPGEYYSFYIHFVDKYGIATNGYNINVDKVINLEVNSEVDANNGILSTSFTNKNGNYIIGIPIDEDSYTSDDAGNIALYYLNVEINSIPDGYIGWFISYEKLEKRSIYKGYSYYLASGSLGYPNGVYTTKFNYDDKLNLNINKIFGYVKDPTRGNPNPTPAPEIIDIINKQFFANNDTNNVLYNSRLLYGGDSRGENKRAYNSWVSLLHDADDLDRYTSKNKLLVPLSRVVYNTGKYSFVDENYDGVLTQLDAVVYSSRFVFDNTDNKFRKLTFGSIHNNSEVYKDTLDTGILIVTRYFIDNFYNESKVFNNKPQIILTVQHPESDNAKFYLGVWTDPKDLVDLYKMPQYAINENYPRMLVNYDPDFNNQTIFDKTIRRSNVIADESLENSWRIFEFDQYINIKENKGKITNLASIGNIFLVHTEHSLFQFDFNDRLTSNGGIIEVDQKDIFESRYTELFNSELGFGGLQESDAYCIGDFGYMWYNTDFKRFFILSKEGPKDISSSINGWLDKVDIRNVRFGDDKFRKRLIIRFDDEGDISALTYNYASTTFVSINKYTINNQLTKVRVDNLFAYTKTKLFMTDGANIYEFNENEYNPDFRLSIINNVNYDEIKFIEYIQYIITKISSNSDNVMDIDYTRPVGRRIDAGKTITNPKLLVPYSGDKLIITSEEISTNQINLGNFEDGFNNKNNVHTNSHNVFYELGKWNLNKLLDTRDGRLFGKYFISTFSFTEGNNNKIEFESINLALTKYRR